MISEELKNRNVSIEIHCIRKQMVTTEQLRAIIEKEEKKLEYSSISFSLQIKFLKRFISRQTFVNMQKPVLIRNELRRCRERVTLATSDAATKSLRKQGWNAFQ